MQTSNSGHDNDRATLSRSEQARVNGSKSRGPITSAGKAISSRNALQHGMTAVASAVALAKAEPSATIGLTLQAAVLPNENPQAAAEILAELTAAHNPVGAAEHRAVELVAAHHWLSLRLLSVQQGYFLNATARATEKIAADFATADERSRAAETFRQIATEDHSFKLLIRYSSETRRAAATRRTASGGPVSITTRRRGPSPATPPKAPASSSRAAC